MANLEVWSPGHGLGLNGNLLVGAGKLANSLIWIPAFVTTQSAWTTGTSYTASTDKVIGSQVTASSCTYVCVTAGGGTSSNTPGGTTTQGTFTGVLADGYNWLCLGTSTADFTNLAGATANQAVSQMVFDNRPSIGSGDPYIQWSVSLATAATGASNVYVSLLTQALNTDGSTYGDGLPGGANLSAPQNSWSATFPCPAGRGANATVIGSSRAIPADFNLFRGCVQNQTGSAFSASPHLVAIRSGALSTNG